MSTPAPIHRPLALLGAVGLALAACQRDQPSPPVEPPAPVPAGPPAPALTPPLDRAALLAALDHAAAAYASGAAGSAPDDLPGRRFSVRIAFGCAGAVERTAGDADGLARWTRDEDGQAIRLSLAPGDWTGSALISGAAADEWEAVEGFWISRPWMRSGDCPAVQPDPLAGAGAPSPQTAGLAAVHEAGGSRLGRRDGRAYSYVVRGDGAAPATRPAGGWRLQLEGRIAAFPDGRAVRCRAGGPDQRPVCVAAVQMDRVAFLAADGTMLREWRTG